MELRILNPPQTRLYSFTIKSSNNDAHKKSSSPSSPDLQFSKKELSRILRTDAAVEAIVEKKSNSSKYKTLSPKPVLEALDHAIKLNRWESALKIFGLLRKQEWYEPRCQTYAKLLVMLGKSNQPNQASLLLETILLDGLQPTEDVYTALLGAFAQNGHFDIAFSILEDMKSVPNCKPHAFTYSILIKCCIKFYRFDMIEPILEEMSLSRIDCTTMTYNILIDGYGKAKYFELMENSLMDMIQTGESHPDIYTFNSVIGAYGRCKRIKEMEKWFDEFQLMGLKPDIMTFNILIKTYGKSGLFRKMGYVLEFMKKRFYSPTIVTYNIMIDTLGKSGNIETMDEIFLKMKQDGMKPNCITYCSLIDAYGKAGIMNKVDSILRQVENTDVVIDTTFFNCAISAYGNAGDLDKMMELFTAMDGNGCKPDSITFSTINDVLRGRGMIEIARNFERNVINTKNTFTQNQKQQHYQNMEEQKGEFLGIHSCSHSNESQGSC